MLSIFDRARERLIKMVVSTTAMGKRARLARVAEYFRDLMQLLHENMIIWAMHTNIDGVYYMFELGVHKLSNLFWWVIWLTLFVACVYMNVTAYNSWRENPVSTSVSTTALPVEDVDFPVITICSLGTTMETVQKAFHKQFLRYLTEKFIDFDRDDDKSTDDLLSLHGFDFVRELYPGAIISPVKMVESVTSKYPVQQLQAHIVVNEGLDACKDKLYLNTSQPSLYQNCQNSLHDPTTETCYEYSNSSKTKYSDAYHVCWNKFGFMMYPFSDKQLLGIIKLIEEGSLSGLKEGHPVWLDFKKSPDGSYKLLNGQKISNSTFTYLDITNTNINDISQRCLVMYYSANMSVFIAKAASCNDHYQSLCYSLPHNLQDKHTCTNETSFSAAAEHNATNEDPLTLEDRFDASKNVAHRKKIYYKAFQSLNLTAAYNNLFELLWYSQLPCFDVNGYSDYPYQRSLLKRCQWKGIDIQCSAIFKTVPTDRGMCCTFNMKAADDIFHTSRYQTMISKLQKHDKSHSLSYSGLPDWYKDTSEPTSEQGINRGLTVTLDAHTDQIESSSVSEDFQGFFAIVNSRNSLPLSRQEAIKISPGKDTLVAMSAVEVKANLKSMAVSDRKCYFQHDTLENATLKIHRNYSQDSCILECQMSYAMDRMAQLGEEPCIPWYLPTLTHDTKMCGPWSAITFRDEIYLMDKSLCSHCLPDCESTIYSQFVTSAPFRHCDSTNLGMSRVCNFQQKQDVRYNRRDGKGEWINEYAAAEKDVAVVRFYFGSATVFQYTKAAQTTWIDYFSDVGGALGICIGFSFCMGVEFVYWSIFRVWYDMRPHGHHH